MNWEGWRLVAIDLETTASEDDGFRIIEVGTATVRRRQVTSVWGERTNPHIPIDDISYEVHGITDADVADAPEFVDLEPAITRHLTPSDTEKVIVVAHKPEFDIPILRDHYQRVGRTLPDVPILDTMVALPHLVGLVRDSRSLDGTCAALGIARNRSHSGSGDAQDTALVAIALIDLAQQAGYATFDDILKGVEAPTVSEVVADLPPRNDRGQRPAVLPAGHLATHDTALPEQPTPDEIETWQLEVAQCARLRCDAVTAKVDDAALSSRQRLSILNDLLDLLVGESEPTAVATLLGGFTNTLRHLPANSENARSVFESVRRWADQRGPALDKLPPCPDRDCCPDCTEGRNCPLDDWPRLLAARIFDFKPYKSKRAYETVLDTRQRDRSKGSYASLVERGHSRIADELLRMAISDLIERGKLDRADRMASFAWAELGARGPHLALTLAERAIVNDDIDAALDYCEQVFAADPRPIGIRTQLQNLHTRIIGLQQTKTLNSASAAPAMRSRHNPKRPHPGLFKRSRHENLTR